MSDPAPDVKRARVAASAAFLLLGLTAGFWFVHIPVIATRLALEPSSLGLLLLCLGIGSLVFQPVAGVLLQRVGSRPAAILFQLVTLVLITAAINAPSAAVMAPILFAAGASFGGTNVSINTQGALVETRLGRPVMSSFHGFFSVGTFSAATLGGAIIALGLGDGRGAIGLALLLAPATLWAGSRFLREEDEDDLPDPTRPASRGRMLKAMTLPLFLMVLLAFSGNAVEFSVNDWSALFLHEVKGVSLAWAASGFAVFSLAMATMRFLGGTIVTRLGAQNMLTLGGALIALGMSIAVLSPAPAGSVFGFFIVALGLANNSPLLVSQAARQPGIPPGIGVSAIATGMTAGYLLAPPITGFIAQALGLTVAFGAMVGVGLLILTVSRILPWQSRPKPTTPVPSEAPETPLPD
jgi:predicted MFS family arabinose efflux permease